MCNFSPRVEYYLRVWLATLAILVIMVGACVAGDIKNLLRIPGEETTQIIKLDDGSRMVGKVTEVGEEEIKFETELGELTIAVDMITDIQEVSESLEGWKKWGYPNPNRTRLILAPTGRTLKAGEGYFSDMMLFFPSVSVGITDNITIGGGVSIFPGVDFDKQLYYFTPKVGFSINERLSMAVSTIVIRLPIEDLFEVDAAVKVIGVLFGTSTIGNENNSMTFGLGVGYSDEDISDKPAILLGGELRVARRMSLITENWVFPEVENPTISYGMRFFGEELSVDLALFNTVGEDATFPGFPFLNFVVNF